MSSIYRLDLHLMPLMVICHFAWVNYFFLWKMNRFPFLISVAFYLGLIAFHSHYFVLVSLYCFPYFVLIYCHLSVKLVPILFKVLSDQNTLMISYQPTDLSFFTKLGIQHHWTVLITWHLFVFVTPQRDKGLCKDWCYNSLDSYPCSVSSL